MNPEQLRAEREKLDLREIDRLVFFNVMGETMTVVDGKGWVERLDKFRPSEKLEDAWEIVRAVTRGLSLEVEGHETADFIIKSWHMTSGPGSEYRAVWSAAFNDEPFSESDAEALAICLAALNWKRIKYDT